MKIITFLLGFVACLTFLIIPVLAIENPAAYITEEVNTDYSSNGSLESVSRTGYVEVEVPNTQDVLQYLRLNLSSTAGTNLQSITAYNSVAASPNAGDKTRIFVNTTDDEQDVSYVINDSSLVPVISFELNYSNLNGGYDIQAGGENTFLFTLAVNCTKNISDVNLSIQIARDTYNQIDAMNLSEPQASASTTLGRMDTDSDGYYDRINWTGDLDGEVTISFNGTLTPGTNFDENDMYLDLDPSYGINSSYSSNQTFTGITFAQRFSRGPIRQGIEMLLSGTWQIKGFIKNIASGLSYSIHGWDLYQIDDLQSPINSSTEESNLSAGETKYTNWYNTGSSAKAYYTVAFNWEVNWDGSNYSGHTQSRMKLPILYEMDTWADKTLTLASNTASGRTVYVNDTARHLGHSGLEVERMEINSSIPNQASDGTQVSWQISGVKVEYVNSSGTYDITSSVNVTTGDSDATSDGYVNVSTGNITGILGHSLGQNEDIRLSYTVTSSSSAANQDFEFLMNSTLWTLSGTPVTKNATESITIAGLAAPPAVPPAPGGGAPPPAPVPVAYIAKEAGEISIIKENIVEVGVIGKIADSGDKGIGNITVMIYVQTGVEFNTSDFSMRIYDNSTGSWKALKRDLDFSITNMGVVSIGERYYTAYLVKKKTGEWHLYDGDMIEINYRAALPFGNHYVLTRISGYNYYQGKIIFEDIYTPIRIPKERVELKPLEIKEGDFEQGIARVGKPVIWIKTFEVYNPNSIPLEKTLNASVLPDVLTAYLIEDEVKRQLELKKDGNNTYAVWDDEIPALETKRYIIEATSPPILEEKRIADVLLSNETMVKFIINITLRNPALETYEDVRFQLPIEFEKVLQVNDKWGRINYTKYDDSVVIHIAEIKGKGVKEITIIYKERPPVLIINLDRAEYLHNSVVTLSGFLIPAEDIYGSHLEIEAIGPEPDLETIYAEISMLEKLKGGEKLEFSNAIVLPSPPTGDYFVDVKFRKDIWTILSAQARFYVKGMVPIGIGIEWFFIIAIAMTISIVERSYIGIWIRKLFEPYRRLRKARMKAVRKRLEKQLAVLERAYRQKLISREAYMKDREKIEKRMKELKERIRRVSEA